MTSISESSFQHIWHPYTQMFSADLPITIVKGKREFLYDNEGNAYIDAVSSWWVNTHGHSNREINKTIKKQINKLEHVIFAGFTHQPAVELAIKLKSLLPNLPGKIFYSDNGSTAVEVALKGAIQYFSNQGINRTKVLAFKGAYHGDTFGTMSVSERSIFNQHFSNYLFDVQYIDLPNGDLNEKLKDLESLDLSQFACFIYEPLVQGAGGMNMYDKDQLSTLLSFLKQKGLILIADEVMTGFFRTGSLFASEQVYTKPDIICLSKGLTAGYLPLGVTAFKDEIYQAFHSSQPTHTLYHGHSFTANPITCSIALKSIALCESKLCIHQVANISKAHFKFSNYLQKHQYIENIRQLGTILAFNIKADAGYNYLADIRNKAYKYFIRNGVVLRPLGNVIYIMPPYCISNKSLNKVYDTIDSFLESIA